MERAGRQAATRPRDADEGLAEKALPLGGSADRYYSIDPKVL